MLPWISSLDWFDRLFATGLVMLVLYVFFRAGSALDRIAAKTAKLDELNGLLKGIDRQLDRVAERLEIMSRQLDRLPRP